jgi:RecA-family ATPase
MTDIYLEDLNKKHPELQAQSNVLPLNINMICVDEIIPKIQPWLWDNIIPLDSFTLFAGLGGLGKSQLLLFIAAKVSTGESFRCGGTTHQMKQGAVILLSNEDSDKYTLVPRLKALGADTSQIHKIRSVSSNKEPFNKRLMALDQDLSLLRTTIKNLKDKNNQTVKLIIVDPIINFIGKTKDYINTEVSNFLFGVTELCEEYGLSFILNKHLRKKDSMGASSAIDEVSGSYAWTTTARQVWIICRDHEDKNKILFLDGKSNIKEHMSGLAFNIKSADFLNKDNETIKTSKIEWLDELVTISPDDAVNKERYEKNKLSLCTEFVQSYIEKNGQSFIKDVIEEGKRQKLGERNLQNAYANLLKSRTLRKEKVMGSYTLRLYES